MTQAATVTKREASVGDFIALLKPRVMSLIVFTGFVGLMLAPTTPSPILSVIAIACIAFGAGASAAFNMWFDRDIDAIMLRTRQRPIPAGRVDPSDALVFAIIIAIGSVMIMGLALNWVAAAWLLAAILFYCVVYTVWLKRRTHHNIVIGGAAGAFPAVIGWAAATGDTTVAPWLLFLIVFLWTPPHFWALALVRNDDYRRANVPMLPVTHGHRATKQQMLIYVLLLSATTYTPILVSLATWYGYGLAVTLLNIGLLWQMWRVWRSDTAVISQRMFAYTIAYLFALFGLLLLDHLTLGAFHA